MDETVTLEVAALVSTTGTVRDPWSAGVNVKSAGSWAVGSVELTWIVPAKSVTRLPWLSTDVTEGVSKVPATVEEGMPARRRRAAGPCSTNVVAEPEIDGLTVSLADSDCTPAVPNLTVTILTPRSAGRKDASGIKEACASLFVK